MSGTIRDIFHKGQSMTSSLTVSPTHTAKISLNIVRFVISFLSLPKGSPKKVTQNPVVLYEAEKFPFLFICKQINKVTACEQSL